MRNEDVHTLQQNISSRNRRFRLRVSSDLWMTTFAPNNCCFCTVASALWSVFSCYDFLVSWHHVLQIGLQYFANTHTSVCVNAKLFVGEALQVVSGGKSPACHLPALLWIQVPALHFARKAPGKVYVYEFTYASKFGLELFNTSLWMGAVHASELGFVFGAPLFHPQGDVTEADKNVSKNMMALWTNFAKSRFVPAVCSVSSWRNKHTSGLERL